MTFPATPPRPDRARTPPPWVPPRGDVPGRPDPPPSPRGPSDVRHWWLAPVAIVAALSLVGVLGLSLADGTRTVGGRPSEALSPPDDGYAFLQTVTELGHQVPVRWNPCEPIRYEVNLEGAPADAIDEIQHAAARVTEATGIPFAFDGLTDRTPRQTVDHAWFSDAVHDTYYPVLFAWIPHERMVEITKKKDVLAFTHPELGTGDRSDQWVSGWVVVDGGGRFESSGRYSLELVLAHELGHLVGLAHVSDPDELMFSEEVAPHTAADQMYDWGPGDLAGLELLGRDQGCLDHVAVSP